MSAETLRRAAALMRENAETARSFYSDSHPKAGREVPWFGQADLYDFDDGDGPHIIGMSPLLALAVADWLDMCAERAETTSAARLRFDHEEQFWHHPALTVARAYLGEETP